jgi:hypothetical protein
MCRIGSSDGSIPSVRHRVVDQDVAVALALGVRAGDHDDAHVDPFAVGRPGLAGVGGLVVVVRELGDHPVADRQLVEDPLHQVVRVRRRPLLDRQAVLTFSGESVKRTNRPAPSALHARFVHIWTVINGSVSRYQQLADTHTFRTAIGK